MIEGSVGCGMPKEWGKKDGNVGGKMRNDEKCCGLI
jgi:hypothetical protein